MWWAWFVPVADAAVPIFLPDFTASRPDDFQVTVMLDGLVQERLRGDGHILLGSAAVAKVVGPGLVERCAETPGCPMDVLPKLPAHISLVVSVGRSGSALVGHIEVYERGMDRPMDVRDVPIASGSEHVFVHEVALAAQAAISAAAPPTPQEMMTAAKIVAGLVSPIAADPELDETELPESPVAPVEEIDEPIETDRGRAVRDMDKLPSGLKPRHLAGVRGHYERFEGDPRDWLYKATPHAGRWIVEVRAGLALGDVDRQADLRVQLQGTTVLQSWYQEGPTEARRVQGGVYIGYAPHAFVDFGSVFGLQWGGRELTTGFVKTAADGTIRDSAISDTTLLDSVMFEASPRVRVTVVPTGPAKPYLYAGGLIRYFSAYDVAQPEAFAYPLPPGGMTPGLGGGGGLMIDPGPIVGIFFEGGYMRHFGANATAQEIGVWDFGSTPIAPPSQGTASLIGGLQFRL